MPAVIKTIQAKTGGQKVAYIGHSQGTTQMFSALSESPDYFTDKVPLFVALGPVSKIPKSGIPFINFVAKFYGMIDKTAKMLNQYELGGTKHPEGGSNMCTFVPKLCIYMSAMFVNTGPSYDDPDAYAVYSAHGPNGTSLNDILHYAQNLKEDRF